MDFEILTSMEDGVWGKIDSLNRSSCEPSPFLTSDYLKVWDRCFAFSAEKIIFAGVSGGKLRGIAAFYRREHPETYFLLGGKSLSDKLGMHIEKGFEEEFIVGFLSLIERCGKFPAAQFVLNNVYGETPQADIFHRLSDMRRGVVVEQVDVSPYVELPSEFEEYIGRLPGKKRHELRRKIKRAEETLGSDGLEVWEDLSGVEGVNPLEEFIRLHKSSNREKLNFWKGKRKDFFNGIAESYALRGWLKILFMKESSRGERVSGLMIFDYHGEFYLYNSGFNPDFKKSSPGVVLIARAIEMAISGGIRRFDFMRGDEKYKFDLGGIKRPVFRVDILL